MTYVGSNAQQKLKKGFDTFSSLRYGDYRYLWIGILFNMGGQWIQQVTLGWLVWELSGSAMMVGITAGLRSLPFIFMGPLGGVVADRVDRRRLLMTVQIVMAAVAVLFAVVVALDWVRVWHAMLFSFVMGCGFAMTMPVRQALIANTVPREELGNAIALSAMAGNTSRVIGPALGGVLIVVFGAAGNFLLQAGLFLCMVATIIPMKTPFRDATLRMKTSAFRSLKEGIKYVWGDKTLFGLMILSFIPSLFVLPILHILPVFTDAVLHAKANIYGYLVASFGVGGLLATLVLASFGNIIRSGLLGIIALTCAAFFVIPLSQSSLPWVAYLLLSSIGFSMMMFRVNNNTLVQMLSPDQLRGRVMSIYQMDHALMPLASSVLGVIADVFSAPAAMATSGIIGLVSIILLMGSVKEIRDLRRVHI
ncbi:MAG: MFS transporter [Desulfobacteraceae bacterium]|nr:MFS transporter [Desulfobacteraceae bacterium]